MKSFWQEFKTFISRGSVLDLAIGMVMGSSFTSIVKSLVDDLIMPIVGIVLGGTSFTSLSITILGVQITYGNFIQAIVNFLVISLFLFMTVKAINTLKKIEEDKFSIKKEEEKKEEKKAADIVLLEEIRDLLKENKEESEEKTE
ncbi:MAG: large conductance mechanosensitive channel protein MscL, partial [Erysipelotrichaceae bacterium]|nr:large conductance mechanosensitive channel protein MscL [Erysipelotrichaceae bacterium]